MNPMVFIWNGKYWCECMGFKIDDGQTRQIDGQVDRQIGRKKCGYVYIHACMYIQMCIDFQALSPE